MTCVTLLTLIGRWSYFLATIAMILGSFVHLNIKFNSATCKIIGPTLDVPYVCLGRNLIWVNQKQISIDSNEKTWRTVFNLGPEQFVDIWCPLFLSMLAFIQHFEGSKWDLISGSWLRTFLFILFWNLFGVFGYAANWGVFMGFVGVCWVNLLYFFLVFAASGIDCPVLQLDLSHLTGRIKSIKERRFSRKDSQIDNDEANDIYNNENNNNTSVNN